VYVAAKIDIHGLFHLGDSLGILSQAHIGDPRQAAGLRQVRSIAQRFLAVRDGLFVFTLWHVQAPRQVESAVAGGIKPQAGFQFRLRLVGKAAESSTSGVSRAKLLNQNNGEVAEWLKAAVC
jgi:hypothetical protein